jgi:predicted DNA-binding ribbon-helix-helix protein
MGGGRWSCVSVEPDFWQHFRLIAFERRSTITALVSEINRKGRLLPFQGRGKHRVLSLSAAIRLCVLQELQAKLEMANKRAIPRSGKERRSYRHSPDRGQLSGLSAWRPAAVLRKHRT